jgi:LPS export ABC transporter protein LptC
MTQRRWPLIALAVLLASLLVYLSEDSSIEPAALLQQAQESNADYIMTGVHMVQYDDQGQRRSEIHADEVSHYKRGSHLIFLHPELRTRSASTSWTLKAGSGNLSEARDLLLLQGGVRIEADMTDEHMQISIDELSVNLGSRIANSPLPLTIRLRGWLMSGQGLSVDVPRESIRIWQHVQAQQL